MHELTTAPDIAFGARRLGAGHPVVVIAEIGVNHEGDPEDCVKLIHAAKQAGADAVKLQSADPDEHYAPDTESHRIFTTARLSFDDTARMFSLMRQLGMEPFTTCGDMPTLSFIESLAPAAHKVSSGMMRHHRMIREFARTGRPLVLSTGMADLADVDAAVAAINSFDEPLLLIAGGASKGADFSALGTCIAASSVRAVLLIGDEAVRIEAAIRQVGAQTAVRHCRDLREATTIARSTAQAGDAILLSPACASFDQFSSYAERGELFKQLVAH